MATIAAGVGSMPGSDFAEAQRVVLGELTDLPHLVELPGRGAGSAMTGRTLAAITDLGFDLQPAGWRLTDASGIDHSRAAADLARDLDTAEELASGHLDAVKLQMAGPWTLAATVERPRGDRVLADHGARRELAEALAEAVRDQVDQVRRRFGASRLVVQIDEPTLPAVLAGWVPTASGFSRHRTVTSQDAAQTLGLVLEAARTSGAEPVVHCCAVDVPLEVLRQAGAGAVSFDVGLLAPDRYDEIGAWVERGGSLWLGAVPSVDPEAPPPTASSLTARLVRWWSDLGCTDPGSISDCVVTPTCGLSGASPSWARTALALCRETARNLTVESGASGS